MLIKNLIYFLLLVAGIGCSKYQEQVTPRNEFLLENGWKFSRTDNDASAINFNDSDWQQVTVPHDWAIYGPFGETNDIQHVAITQNLEKQATVKTGRTGGLPYVGVGWYRTTFNIDNFDEENSVKILFDGAMSEARVYVNGIEACFWPYGYNSFHCDITRLINKNGKDNILAVRLENQPESSRWYPGAGLYRNVHVIVTNEIHIPVWGTHVTTPEVSEKKAKVVLVTNIENSNNNIRVSTEILDPNDLVVTKSKKFSKNGNTLIQELDIINPDLWSPESPDLYKAITKLYNGEKLVDEYATRFGIRSLKLVADEGFFLNGKKRKFQGVCNHHDLGPLGAAVSKAAIRRQLTLLKDMGCDAIRTSHNMPAPELVELCDEMGFMMILEPFDEWDIAKCKNGYHRFFNEWAEKDMVNMLHHYRNNPSVVMWSIGNEVPSQCQTEGYGVAKFLYDICKREDPTRPITCGMDQVICVLKNGIANLLDVPGFNYRVHLYQQAYDTLSHKLVLGSETASTVSSRGVYKFPPIISQNAKYNDNQCSSYDLEYCWWSNLPDNDFAMAEDYRWTIGQFVWTGFDYLGEPTPYDGSWPNHSSMFGIIDLASIPKDRYYLYRSQWNKNDNTLHILPHWNWEGREGRITPVFVYTNFASAELFVNGKSYGVQTKNDSTLLNRYRLMWNNVVYEPGEVKVIAYDKNGQPAQEAIVRTAGEPDHIILTADRMTLDANGKDLAYINVKVVDKEGNFCATDNRLVTFNAEGAGTFRAAANGDPTCLDLFHLPEMHLFNGQLTAIVQSGTSAGKLKFSANANEIEGAQIDFSIK
jgi:beta-galactosidase